MAGNFGIYHDGWWAGTRPAKAPWDLLQAREYRDRRPDMGNSMTCLPITRRQKTSLACSLRGWRSCKSCSGPKRVETACFRCTIPPRGRASQHCGGAYVLHLRTRDCPHSGKHCSFDTWPLLHHRGGCRSLRKQVRGGVLATHGGRFGGYSFYVKDGRLAFQYNAIGERQTLIAAPMQLPAGRHRLTASFQADRPERGSGGCGDKASR